MTTEIANKDESLIQKKEIFGLNDLRNLLISQNTHQPTDAEMYVFKKLCEDSGANPFLRDIHVVKYGANSPASFIFGKDYFTKVARAQNAIWDCGILVVRKGESIETKKVGTFMLQTDTLVGGWCDVHTKDGTIPTTVLLEDFDTGKSLWSKMPGTMIEKCAIVKALRMAFPEKLAGAYAAEEMEQARAFHDVNLTEDINRASVQAVPLQEIEPTGQIIEHEPKQEVITASNDSSSNTPKFWCGIHKIEMTQSDKQKAKDPNLASHRIGNTGNFSQDFCNGGSNNKPRSGAEKKTDLNEADSNGLDDLAVIGAAATELYTDLPDIVDQKKFGELITNKFGEEDAEQMMRRYLGNMTATEWVAIHEDKGYGYRDAYVLICERYDNIWEV